MFKRLVASLMFFAAVGASAAEYSVTRTYVYPITSEGKVNGSAVLFQKGFLLTAAHALDETPPVIFHKGNVIKTRVIKKDYVDDLALLHADIDCPCIPLISSPLEIDSDVVVVGFPVYNTYGLQIATTGTYQGMYEDKYLTTAPTAGGGSGGGMFVKEHGEYRLAGIVRSIGISPIRGSNGLIAVSPKGQRMYQENNWIVISIPAKQVKAFLRGTPAQQPR